MISLKPDVLALALGIALLALGAFTLVTRERVIQQVLGLNVMLQGALALLLSAGLATGELALTQGMIISALLVETVIMSIILALIVNVHRYHPEGRTDDLDQLRG